MPRDSPARFIAPTAVAVIVPVLTIVGSHRLGVATMVIIGIVEIDLVADPERLRQLNLVVLND